LSVCGIEEPVVPSLISLNFDFNNAKTNNLKSSSISIFDKVDHTIQLYQISNLHELAQSITIIKSFSFVKTVFLGLA
jgi:hypothetical protein